MPKQIQVVHHADRRTDVVMPYAPAVIVHSGKLVFFAGLGAAPVYHSHPHKDEEFELPASMTEQAELAMRNLKKSLDAVGCTFSDIVSATRYLTDIKEQDDLNRVWAKYMGTHLTATATVEVSRLVNPRLKLEIMAIAVTNE